MTNFRLSIQNDYLLSSSIFVLRLHYYYYAADYYYSKYVQFVQVQCLNINITEIFTLFLSLF